MMVKDGFQNALNQQKKKKIQHTQRSYNGPDRKSVAAQQSKRFGLNVNIGQQTKANTKEGVVGFAVAFDSHQIQRRMLTTAHIMCGC